MGCDSGVGNGGGGSTRLIFPFHQVAEIVLYLSRVVPHLQGSPSANHFTLPRIQLCPPGKTGFVPQMQLGHPHLRLQSQHVLRVWKLGRIHVCTRFPLPLPPSRCCKRPPSTPEMLPPVSTIFRRSEGRIILLFTLLEACEKCSSASEGNAERLLAVSFNRLWPRDCHP